jgi:hypothetical protein
LFRSDSGLGVLSSKKSSDVEGIDEAEDAEDPG